MVRAPQTWQQAMWGGSTCRTCGCEVDKWGNESPTSHTDEERYGEGQVPFESNGNAMAKKSDEPQEHLVYHKDGSIWAKGQKLDDVMVGYWEWFRKDGTKMRSGSFENGEQVGEWTTYDKYGEVYKVTKMRKK